jgi:Lrp/AsnC family transcriptional regulator for asnA, asnC and gidA
LKLTTLDRQIMELLNQDARLPSTHISRRLGVAQRTVRSRIERLVAAGVIRTVAVVQPAAFGYDLVVDIFCEIEIARREDIVQALLEMPEVSYIAISTGEQDISLQAMFKSSADMHAFITERLYEIPGIRHTRTALVPRILKDSYQWFPPYEAFEP